MQSGKGFSGVLYSTQNDSLIFMDSMNRDSRGALYNYYSQKYSTDFLFPKKIEMNSFHKDGVIEVTKDYVLFASVYFGYVMKWDIHTGDFFKKHQIFEAPKQKSRQAKIRGFGNAYLPPKTEISLSDIVMLKTSQYELLISLIESKVTDAEFSSDYLYVYSTRSEKIIQKLALDGKANDIEIYGYTLAVHYEELDKLILYDISVK